MVSREREEGGQSSETRSDPLARLFARPVFLALTIGIPFCTFKLLFGVTAVRVASQSSNGFLFGAGLAIAAWALADLAMNVGRLSSISFTGKPVSSTAR